MTNYHRLFTVSLLIIFCSLLTGCNALAQIFGGAEERAEDLYDQGYNALQNRNYEQAEENFRKAIDVYPDHHPSYYVLSDIYHRQGKTDKEIEILEQLLNRDLENSRAHYNLGLTFFSQGEYQKSLNHYQQALEFGDQSRIGEERIKNRMEETEFALKLVEDPVDYDPENLGPGVNTRNDEYWPALTADERQLYFTRLVPDQKSRDKEFREDIFLSKKEDGEWQEAGSPPGPLNSELNEGAIALSPDGRYLIFTGCNRPDVIGRCDLYKSEFKNNEWTEPENMGDVINSRHLDRQPSISFDGNTLYFSSSRPGNQGDLDLWKSERDQDGEWQEPENLGDKINTEGDEQAPFIHPDNETLYFVSTGHMGLGGQDIFYARKGESGEFDTVKNMGYPINTHENSFSLMVSHSGDQAYFASEADPNIENEGMDIFSFEMPEEARPRPTTYLQGRVFDAETELPLGGADFEIIDIEDGQTIVESEADGETGEFLISLPADRDYALNVNKEDYLFYSENLALKEEWDKSEPFIQDIGLQPIEEGEAVVMDNIFFELDSYELKDESMAELERLVRFMQNNPDVNIEIGGHTDNQGAPAYNLDLSENRAKTVYNYLVEEGEISSNRISYQGYGEEQPIATNETEEGRAQNRRTEFKILDN